MGCQRVNAFLINVQKAYGMSLCQCCAFFYIRISLINKSFISLSERRLRSEQPLQPLSIHGHISKFLNGLVSFAIQLFYHLRKFFLL